MDGPGLLQSWVSQLEAPSREPSSLTQSQGDCCTLPSYPGLCLHLGSERSRGSPDQGVQGHPPPSTSLLTLRESDKTRRQTSAILPQGTETSSRASTSQGPSHVDGGVSRAAGWAGVREGLHPRRAPPGSGWAPHPQPVHMGARGECWAAGSHRIFSKSPHRN